MLLLLLLLPASLAPQPASQLPGSAPAPLEWEDPQVVGVNKEEPHAPVYVYPDAAAAASRDRARTPYHRLLNGEWRFHWSPDPDRRPTGFHETTFDDSSWGTIPVPSNMELHGHGVPIYVNIGYAWGWGKPPRIPRQLNSVGSYRRRFELPAAWSGRRVLLTFDGVSAGFYLWVNGKKVGYSEDSRTPAEFDVTAFVRPGENLLAAEVYRFTDGSYLECQDFWRLSGIFRDVALWSTEPLHLRDFRVVTDLDARYRDATLRLEVALRNAGQPQAYALEASLLDGSGRPAAPTSRATGSLAANEPARVALSQVVRGPLLWSDEKPNLYTLLLTLRDGSGRSLGVVPWRVGFRKVEVADGKILVNGQPIVIRGVNRHEHDPRTGQYVRRDSMLRDLELLKQNNFNLVRTAHYPNTPEWYELADLYGIYLISEANIESHGMGYNPGVTLGNDPQWEKAHLDRTRRMLETFKNHASVILWSLGNEAGDGVNFLATSRYVRENDPTRPVHYERAGERAHVDVVSHMYQPAAEMEREARNGDPRPLIQCEYSHAMGNSNGGFDRYWRLFKSGTRARGGAIWDWIDQGLEQPLPARLLVRDRSRFGLEALLVGGSEPGNGAEGYLSLPDATQLDLREALTLEVSVRPRPVRKGAAYPQVARYHPFLSKGDLGFQLMQDDEDLQLRLRLEGEEDPLIVRAPAPADWYQAWHRLAGTYDGRVGRLYLDGRLVASAAKAGRLAPGHFPVNVGRNPERIDVRTPARLREARVYARALGEAELRDPSARSDDRLVLWLDVADVREAGSGGGGTYFAYGGDFGPTTTPSDENFCQNGVLSADRSPHPALGEIRKMQQYVEVTGVDPAKGVVSIRNGYDFTVLSEIAAGTWQVRADDRVMAEGAIGGLDLSPHAERELSLPVPSFDPAPGVEYWLDFTFALEADTRWAKAGHVLAWESLRLPVQKAAAGPPAASLPELTVESGEAAVTVKGRDFAVGFDAATGLLSSLRYQGTALLAGPLHPYFWRPPNDNDRGSDMMRRLGVWRDAHRFFVRRSIRTETPAKGVVRVGVEGELTSVRSSYRLVYTVYGTGDVAVEASFVPGPSPLPDLPRFGMRATLAPGFERLSWYGPGPEESYSDRRDLRVDVYRTTVDSNYFRYSQPQETGNKTEARWAALTSEAGVGLLVVGQPLLGVNALHYPAEEIDQANHHHHLRPRPEVYLNLDARQMGLGGDDSWGALPHPEHRIPAAAQAFRFRLRPFAAASESPMALSKVSLP